VRARDTLGVCGMDGVQRSQQRRRSGGRNGLGVIQITCQVTLGPVIHARTAAPASRGPRGPSVRSAKNAPGFRPAHGATRTNSGRGKLCEMFPGGSTNVAGARAPDASPRARRLRASRRVDRGAADRLTPAASTFPHRKRRPRQPQARHIGSAAATHSRRNAAGPRCDAAPTICGIDRTTIPESRPSNLPWNPRCSRASALRGDYVYACEC